GKDVDPRRQPERTVIENWPLHHLVPEPDLLTEAEPMGGRGARTGDDPHATGTAEGAEDHSQLLTHGLEFYRRLRMAAITADITDEAVPVRADSLFRLERHCLSPARCRRPGSTLRGHRDHRSAARSARHGSRLQA